MDMLKRETAEEREGYLTAMLENFEHENPGVAEMLALHDRAMQHYVKVINAYYQPVVRTSSSHTIMTGN